jgi:hypothetical protein
MVNCCRLADRSKHNLTSLMAGCLAKTAYLAGDRPTLADLVALRLNALLS